MTRWSDTCFLLFRTFDVDREGVRHEKTTGRQVYCNSYTLSTQAWATAKLADYRADDEIQLRTSDYADEQDVIWRGVAYSVEHVMVQGDFTRLILKQHTHDIGDEADIVTLPEPEPEPDPDPTEDSDG